MKIALPCSNTGYPNTVNVSNGALVQLAFIANGSYKQCNNMYIQPVTVVANNVANLNYDANTEAIPIFWVSWANTQFRPNPGADMLYVTIVANEGIGHQNLSSTYVP